jgi:hypothetical protein
VFVIVKIPLPEAAAAELVLVVAAEGDVDEAPQPLTILANINIKTNEIYIIFFNATPSFSMSGITKY